MRTMRVLPFIALSMVMLCTPRSAWADTQTQCQQAKLKAVAKSVKGVFGCAPKDLAGVTLSGFDALCIGDVAATFPVAWATAIRKAAAKDVSCFNAPSAGSVATSVVAAATGASAVIRAGFAPADDALADAVKLLNSLMKASGTYMAATLSAHAKNANAPDAGALASSVAKAFAKLEAKVSGEAQKAAAKGIAWTGGATGLTAAVDVHVNGLALGITTNPAFPLGSFVDSGVAGVEYSPALDAGPNLTLEGGLFPITDPTMSFSIGGIVLGEVTVPATGFVTPVTLVPGAVDETHPVVTNLARFLQTLDDDAKTAKGISIPAAILAATANATLDFDDESAVITLAEQLTALTKAGPRPAVSVEDARDHLRGTLLGVLSGSYAGTFSGDDSGTWAAKISASGKITGSGISNDVGKFKGKGQIDSSGAANIAAGSVSTGAQFLGTVDADGNFGGTWVNAASGESGTFSGSLVD